MMKNCLFKIMLCLAVCLFSFTAKAQSNADKLFLEGQRLQKTMTVASQSAAIKKFQAAKVLYTAASKKTMCDNQISACNTNIKNLKPGGSNAKKTNKVKDNKKSPSAEETPVPVPEVKKREVTLSLSASRLDFKSKPKEGYTQSVVVTCNFDDWTVYKKPDWVSVYSNKNMISIEVAENTSDQDRSGVVTVKCDDTEAELIVNQDCAKPVDRIVGGVKDLFKKKKKK